MSTWIVRALGWIAAILVVVLGLVGRDPEVGARSRELLRAYAVPADGAATLALPLRPGVREIRVRLWLEDPAWGPPDDRQIRPARIAARVDVDPVRPIFEADTWMVFRRRPVATEAGIAARERLAGPGGAALSDPRVWRFSLPARAEPTTLELRALDVPPGATLLAAVWAGVPGEPVLGNGDLASEPGLVWTRLSAIDGGGRGFTAKVVEAALVAAGPMPGATATLVPPGGAVAFNLDDPRAILHAEWWHLDGAGPVAARASVRTPRGVELASGPTIRAVPGEAPASVSIVLDPSESPRLLRAWTEGSAPVSWGAPPTFPDGIGRAVGPDLRRTTAVRLNASEPASWEVAPGEALRVVARPRLPAAPLPGFDQAPAEGAATLVLRFEDASGTEVARSMWSVPRVPSAWERYASVDDPRTARVGEPVAGRIVAPDGARRAILASDEPVDVTLWVPSGLTDELHPAYEGEVLGVEARYVPQVRSRWALRGPERADDLLSVGRIVDIDAQVRLEPARSAGGPTDDPAPRSFQLRPLPLDRPHAWLLVKASGERSASGRARIGPTPRLLRPRADGSAFVEVRRPPERVAEPLRLRVEGREIVLRPRSTASTHRLTGLPSPFVIASSDPGVLVVPQRDGELRKLRVWRLDAGDRVVLQVPADGGRLAIQSWGAGFSWRIDGELQPGQVYEALPVVDGVVAPGQGAPAQVFSEARGAVPAARTFRRSFDPAEAPRQVVLTATGPTYVRPLASWGEGSAADEERIWWLPEPIVVAEAAP